MTAAEKTRGIVEARIDSLTPDIKVRDWEVRHIEKTMEDAGPEAHRLHAGDSEEAYWARIQYYKAELLNRFENSSRPRLAAVFHQYVASCKRGGRGGRVYAIDESGCVDLVAVT